MLVLTRKRTESIKIGNDIVIKVIHTSHGSVKLGIEAPPNVRVLRAELSEFHDVHPVANATQAPEVSLETVPSIDSTTTEDHEHPMDFTTDYAMEIEDQMHCVAASTM